MYFMGCQSLESHPHVCNTRPGFLSICFCWFAHHHILTCWNQYLVHLKQHVFLVSAASPYFFFLWMNLPTFSGLILAGRFLPTGHPVPCRHRSGLVGPWLLLAPRSGGALGRCWLEDGECGGKRHMAVGRYFIAKNGSEPGRNDWSDDGLKCMKLFQCISIQNEVGLKKESLGLDEAFQYHILHGISWPKNGVQSS